MKIIILKKLTEENINSIRNLEQEAESVDQISYEIFLDSSFNFSNEIRVHYLMYDNDKLIGYLNIFAPNKFESEIQSVIHPDYRRRQCFTVLLETAQEELSRFNIQNIVLVCSSLSKSAKGYIQAKGYPLMFSEYVMKYSEPFGIKEIDSSNYQLHLAEHSNIDDYAKYHKVIFSKDKVDNYSIIKNILYSEDRTLYIFSSEEEDVGVGSIYISDETVTIFGFGIKPDQRGKGISKIFLRMLVTEIVKKGYTEIYLEVDSLNVSASNLYLKNGFKIDSQVDYYTVSSGS